MSEKDTTANNESGAEPPVPNPGDEMTTPDADTPRSNGEDALRSSVEKTADKNLRVLADTDDPYPNTEEASGASGTSDTDLLPPTATQFKYAPSSIPEDPKAGEPTFHLTEQDRRTHEDELRGRLGLLPIGVKLPSRIRMWGWIVTAVAGMLAFVTRFWNLNHPRAIVFDETYYVKGAFSLLHQGYEGNWQGDKANDLFLHGDYSALKESADYVVHPPLGKWLMAVGQWLFGSDNGVGWRFSTAFFGVLSVVLIVRIAMRMFRSPILAGFAGIAMALDGMGIVLSRTGILDNILAFFVLLGFWALLLDRQHMRAKLAAKVARGRFRAGSSAFIRYTPSDPWGPRILWRPWLIASGIALGFAGGVKWSAIYAVAVFGLTVFAWGISARRIVGVRMWIGAGVFRDGIPAFLALVPTAVMAYLASWISWFLNPNSWGRHWAEEAIKRGEKVPFSWAPDALNSFIHYHQDMWKFHHGLSSPHDYQSQMWDWIIQRRPVSFYWQGTGEAPKKCGSLSCVEAITSIGNVAVWWLGLLALIVVILAAIMRKDWRAWAILSGYGAMWLPWLSYTNRTIFQFYAVAFLPYVVLALTYAVGVAAQLLGRAYAGQPQLSFGFISSRHHPPQHLSPQPSQYPAPPPSQYPPQPQGPRTRLRNAIASRFDDEYTSSVATEAARPPETFDAGTIGVSPGIPSTPGVPETSPSSQAGPSAPPWQQRFGFSGKAPLGPHSDTLANSGALTPSRGPVPVVVPPQAPWWAPPVRRTTGIVLTGAVTALIIATAAFWYPLWTGQNISHGFWQLHMWLHSWI